MLYDMFEQFAPALRNEGIYTNKTKFISGC